MFNLEEKIQNQQNLEGLKNTKPGDIIIFGTYPQTANGEDKTPIK